MLMPVMLVVMPAARKKLKDIKNERNNEQGNKNTEQEIEIQSEKGFPCWKSNGVITPDRERGAFIKQPTQVSLR